MAITAAVATVAVAAGTTVYNISEQKKAAQKQADQASKQEAQQAAIANETKQNENRMLAQSFAAAQRRRGQSNAATNSIPSVTAGNVGGTGAAGGGTKTQIGT